MSFQFDHWEIDESILPPPKGLGRNKERAPSITSTKPPKRSINFATTCSVVLIPSRKEYLNAGIDLWFNRYDQALAQKQVADEVKGVLYDHPSLSIMTAMTYLYQPRNPDECCAARPKEICDAKERLNVLILHPDPDAYQQAARTLKKELFAYSRWVLSTKHVPSQEAAIRLISTSTSMASRFDVILIHETLVLGDEADLMALMDCIRICYDESALVGLLVSDRSAGLSISPSGPSSGSRKRLDSAEADAIALNADVMVAEAALSTASSPIRSDEEPPAPGAAEGEAEGWLLSGTGLDEQRGRGGSFCATAAKDPTDVLLHSKAREFNVDFLWREPLSDSIVHMLPLLLVDQQQASRESKNGYFRKTRSPPHMSSPQAPGKRLSPQHQLQPPSPPKT